jgi:hypothetical protein
MTNLEHVVEAARWVLRARERVGDRDIALGLTICHLGHALDALDAADKPRCHLTRRHGDPRSAPHIVRDRDSPV